MLAAAGTATALSLGVAACGGGSSSKSATSSSTPAVSTSTTTPSTVTTATVLTGPVHATLHGDTHTPAAGVMWHYTVRVTDPHGQPLTGTVRTQFTFAGQVVGTESPPVHKLKHGVLRDAFRYPRDAIGHPIAMVTIVRTRAGSVTLTWPIKVRQ
jgi:hypothetical protein